MAVKRSGEELVAPGILRNPIPVDALYDRRLAHGVELRNLLQREGYASLDAVRAEGATRGALEQSRAALRRILEVRGIAIGPPQDAAIEGCGDLGTLDAWQRRAILAASAADVFG